MSDAEMVRVEIAGEEISGQAALEILAAFVDGPPNVPLPREIALWALMEIERCHRRLRAEQFRRYLEQRGES